MKSKEIRAHGSKCAVRLNLQTLYHMGFRIYSVKSILRTENSCAAAKKRKICEKFRCFLEGFSCNSK